MKKKKTGVAEWAKHKCNIQKGCRHGCLYCYARWSALFYNRIANGSDWTNEVINQEAVDKGYRKRDGVIMFPTTHDITEHNYKQCGIVLQKLLDAGNKVLVVTKGNWDAIMSLILDTPLNWEVGQLEIRISIGALNDSIREFWEPSAPTIQGRLALLYALYDSQPRKGAPTLITSVSMEPLLEPERVEELVAAVDPSVSGKIWIGKLNKMRQRTDWYCKSLQVGDAGTLHGDDNTMQLKRLIDEYDRIESHQTDEAVMEIYDKLKDHPKIEWKDSYKEVIERNL